MNKIRPKSVINMFGIKCLKMSKTFVTPVINVGPENLPIRHQKPYYRKQKYVVGVPIERWAIDTCILGPLPLTPKKNMYLMVVGDFFTKWIDAIPVKMKRQLPLHINLSPT